MLTLCRGELDSLRSALEAASTQKRRLELQASTSADDIQRLTQANNTLSAQTLSLAEDAEGDKKAMQQKLHDEIESLRKQLEDAQEEIDEARTRGSAQRIQLLDEVCTVAHFLARVAFFLCAHLLGFRKDVADLPLS